MILIPVPVFGEGGPGHLAVESVSGFVGGVAVERIICDQSIANRGTEVGARTFGAACKNKYGDE